MLNFDQRTHWNGTQVSNDLQWTSPWEWRIFHHDILFVLLGRHRLTDDDKRHQCTFCPMKFFKRDKLTRHIRTHTGEKRKFWSITLDDTLFLESSVSLLIAFKCPFCSDRAYAQKGDLTKHIKLKHVGNKIYNCDNCQEGFQYYADLKTHSFEHYKEEKAKQEAVP